MAKVTEKIMFLHASFCKKKWLKRVNVTLPCNSIKLTEVSSALEIWDVNDMLWYGAKQKLWSLVIS